MSKTKLPKKFVPEGALYFTKIKSRHPSHNVLRRNKGLQFPFKSLVRFGSQTELDPKEGKVVEINTVAAVKNSASKLLMKNCFAKAGIVTAEWCQAKNLDDFLKSEKFKYPIVAKHHFGSRGRGNTLIKDKKELDKWKVGKNLDNYIFEQFYNYSREYRVHVSRENGAFYSCRKMLKNGTPEANKWYRNDSNCVWVLETNPDFDAPVNWKEIQKECLRALDAVGLDVGAIDVKVQSAHNGKREKRKSCKFIIIETNSAPSFGEITEQKYLEQLQYLIRNKK